MQPEEQEMTLDQYVGMIQVSECLSYCKGTNFCVRFIYVNYASQVQVV